MAMSFAKQCLDTSIKVLISPNSKVFLSESKKGEKQFSGIVVWLVLFAVYFSLMISIQIKNLLTSLAISISMSMFIPFTVVLTISATNFIYQKVYSRKEYIYDRLLYITTAIIVSIQVIAMPLLLLLPENVNTYFGYSIYFYQLILIVIAFKAISGLNYLRTIIMVVLSLFAGAVIWSCMAPFILSMMGGVNNVF